MSDAFRIIPYQVRSAGTNVPPEEIQAGLNSLAQQTTIALNTLNSGESSNVNITGGTIANVSISNSTGVTQSRIDNSTLLATDQFVNQQIASATANVPIPLTGGIYNQASRGTGASFVIFVSGGVISSVVSIVNGGTSYAVGDLLLVIGGNYDGLVRVTNVVGGVIQSGGLAVLYGGTGYSTGATTGAVPVPPGQRSITLTGVLTSNVTFIIQNGTFLTAARRIEANNNTTGAFTVTVFLSNGIGGTTGSGVVLPQGTNNSSAVLLQTDGMNDVWRAETPLGIGAVASAGGTLTGGTITGSTINSSPVGATTPSTGAFTTLSATSTVSGAGFTSLFASPPAIGGTAPAAGAFTTLSATTNNPTLNYLLAATGSVARSFVSKFGDTVSIRDFGADPTGVADSTAAIQAAITYVLSLANGGAVYMPAGTYKVTAQINAPNVAGISLRVYGDGAGTRLKYTGAATTNIFFCGSATPTFGSFYVFDSFGFLGPTGGSITAMYFKNINDPIFYNVDVLGNMNALVLESCFNVRVIGCDFNTQSQYGIATNVSGTNNLLVSNCVISNAAVAAITLAGGGGNNIVIRDNDFEANAVTFAATAYTSILFEGNYCENNTNAYFSFSGANSSIDIRQNWLGANTTSSTISNVTSGSFTNNTLFNCGFTFASAFDIDCGGNTLIGTATISATLFQTTISLLNNWTASSRTVGYKKSANGMVEVRGNLVAGTGSLGNVAFVLPVGYRPSQQYFCPIIDQSLGSTALCIVDTNGNVSPNAAGGAVGNVISLDGIRFTAAF